MPPPAGAFTFFSLISVMAASVVSSNAAMLEAFCSAERADEWQAFIEARAEQLPGYERTLAQATESVRLCAALREAKAAELVTAFRNYR